MGGTGHPAWGSIEFFYCKTAWNGLGVSFIDGLTIYQFNVIFVRPLSRAYVLTVAAGSTFIRFYITGTFTEGYLEISFCPIDVLDIRTGMEFDVGMPADLDQFRRDNSHGTIIGWEGLVQLRHYPADSRGFFDEMNIIAGIRQIQGRLHACNAAPDNHNSALNLFDCISIHHWLLI